MEVGRAVLAADVPSGGVLLSMGTRFLWGMVPKVQQGGTEFEALELVFSLSRKPQKRPLSWLPGGRGCWAWLSRC